MILEPAMWDTCAWQCPRCSLGEDEVHSLVLIRSADREVDQDDIQEEHGVDSDNWERANNTAKIVACVNCKSVFDVGLRERKNVGETLSIVCHES